MSTGENTMKNVRIITVVATTALLGAGSVWSANTESGDDRDGSRDGNHRSWGHRGGHGPGAAFRDPAKMIERMARHLDLDETQQQTINNIVEAARPEFETLREQARENRTAMRELETTDPDYSAKLNNLAVQNGELMASGTILFGRVRAELAAELTEEQRAKLEARMQEGRKRFRQRRGARDEEPAQ